MPPRDRKEKDGLGQVVEITKDYLLDKVEEAPLGAAAAAATLAFEKLKQQRQLKKFLAQGGGVAQAQPPPGTSVSKFPTVGRAMVKGALGRAPVVGAAVEGAKGLYLIGKEGAREGHAEEGEELMRRPKIVQAGKFLFDTAGSMSRYGAAMEARDHKAFREKHNIPATYPDMMTREESRDMAERKGRVAKDIRELLARSGK